MIRLESYKRSEKMPIQPTKDWLLQYIQKNKDISPFTCQEKTICAKLSPYFDSIDPELLQHHLLHYGLFVPTRSDSKQLLNWLDCTYDKLVGTYYQKLKKRWNGPSVDIFLFPSDTGSRELTETFGGCAGISYPTKIILFLSDTISKKQLLALLAHEYSHSVRLQHFAKPELDYILLDALILEGIAEYLVRKLVGVEYSNQTMDLLEEREARHLYQKWVQPHLNIKRDHPTHDILMYGNGRIRKNLGYHIGFFLVHHYMQKQKLTEKELLYVNPNDLISEWNS